MILLLDESLIEASNQNNTQEKFDAQTTLIICAQHVREGSHIIFGKIKTLDAVIKNCKSIDSQSRATLIRARDKITQRKQIFDFSQCIARIVRSTNSKQPERAIFKGKIAIEIPINFIAKNSSILGKSLLLTEHLNDAKLYLRLSKSLATCGLFPEWSQLSEIPLRAEFAPGGGNTIADLFEYHKEQNNRIGIAIVDSDQRYPGGPIGDTASRLLTTKESEPKSVLLETEVITSRTIENLIPPQEISRIANKLDKAQGYRADQAIDCFSTSPFWMLYPIKNGVRCIDISSNRPESKFWQALTVAMPCNPDNACKKKEDCGNQLTPGISSSLLKLAAQESANIKISQHPTPQLYDAWKRLVLAVFSWFCGAEKIAHI